MGRHAEEVLPERGRGWRIIGWISVAMSALLVVGSLTAYGFYWRLHGNIQQEDVRDKLGDNRPAKLDDALNVLVIGSDSREGDNRGYGQEEGARSDTAILLHLSPGGEQAIGVSFPRDLMVQLPSCEKRDGGKTPSHLGMFNSAYSIGGPACTWKTIEAISNVRVDHFVEIDFSGFKQVVDALGGVEVCVPKAIDDPKADLRLRAGRQTVKGDEALGYVRTRTGGLGDGSDLARIDRQKRFMASVTKKATSGDILRNPPKLYSFLSSITSSIKTDSDLSTDVMLDVAGGMRDLAAGGVRFVTVPVRAYAPDPNRVELIPERAGPLFDAIRRNNAPPEEKPPGNAQGAGGAEAAKMDPRHVKVQVFNATDTDGLAGRVAPQLERAGFTLHGEPATAATKSAQTQIRYGPGAKRRAAKLAASVRGVRPQLDRSVPKGVVHLLLGDSWDGFQGLGRQRDPGIPKMEGEVKGDQNICAAP